MNPITISLIVFACLIGGALLGMFLRPKLPEHHLSAESKQIVNLGMGIIGTMSALVLGLLVASAKGSFDTQSNELTEISAKVILLDRVLAHYGPESKRTRDQLRTALSTIVVQVSPQRARGASPVGVGQAGGEAIYEELEALTPTDDAQKALKAQALSLAMTLGQTRWLMFQQAGISFSRPLLGMLTFWLAINFISLGLFAPRNATVIVTLCLCAIAVSGAIFLIMEMYVPFQGFIRVSDAPMQAALAQLGK